MHLCTLCKENKQVELQILAPWRNQSNNSACVCVCVCVIINLLIKTQTRTHKHTHTHGHAQAGKQTQTITCNVHSHTCKRYCKMRSPGAALYSLPPTPRFTSSLSFYFRALPQQQQQKNTRRHTQQMPEYLFLHQSK